MVRGEETAPWQMSGEGAVDLGSLCVEAPSGSWGHRHTGLSSCLAGRMTPLPPRRSKPLQGEGSPPCKNKSLGLLSPVASSCLLQPRSWVTASSPLQPPPFLQTHHLFELLNLQRVFVTSLGRVIGAVSRSEVWALSEGNQDSWGWGGVRGAGGCAEAPGPILSWARKGCGQSG